MKIFIGNKYNLKLYTIPEVIEDSYLLKYHSYVDNDEKNITIINKNNKLIINNNINMNLFEDGKSAETIKLEQHKLFSISFNDTGEELNIYCLPSNIKYYDYKVEKNYLRIGQANNNDIVYKNSFFKTNTIEFINKDDRWYIKSDKIIIYINNNPTTKSALNYGDEIFIFGLKIIWLRGFIRLNKVPNLEINMAKYNIGDFFDTKFPELKLNPINKNKKEELVLEENDEEEIETITLETPPSKETNNDFYFLVAIGSSFTLAITSLASILTTILSIASGNGSFKEDKISIIVGISLIICSLLFPLIVKKWQKISLKKKENNRITQYQEYLNYQKTAISNTINKKENNLRRIYLDSKECQKRVLNNENLWIRNINNKSFLKVRFGKGDIPANIVIDTHKLSLTYENPLLKDQLRSIQKDSLYLKNVPIAISLIHNRVLPVIIDENKYKNYIDSLLLQLISFHSNSNLKLVFLVSEENHSVWDNYKYLPHVFDEQNNIRFFAYEKNDINNIISYLEETYQNRLQKLGTANIKNREENYCYTNFNDYYLIITDNFKNLSNQETINKILYSKDNFGFSMLSFEKNNNKKYIDYTTYIDVREDKIISNNINSFSEIPKSFIPDITTEIDVYNIVKNIANLQIISYSNKTSLPKEITLLDMYKVGKVEQLNIKEKWKENNPVLSLRAPIGMTNNNEIIELDLHEKYNGPNCLIAGMVGYGKLELLITYITSMCINYNPFDVQFVLIDYKNSGLINAFKNNLKNMPHIVGTMEELDASEIYRIQTSIKKEVNRRKEVFIDIQKELGESNIDIYKYQSLYRDGKAKEPISHLFIIVYEYYDIYNNYPERFEELLNLIYSSSSLGLHLILSTQNPSEAINNQIYANSRTKICTRVKTLNDSELVLHRREATSLSIPGRFYLEVGYNEIFKQVQGAYSSAIYNPKNLYEEKLDESIYIINDSGIITREISEETNKNVISKFGKEIDNVRNHISSISEYECKYIEDLWLPSITKELSLSNIIKEHRYKTSPYQFNSIIGEYDDLLKKEQKIFTIDLSTSNNTIIYGLPGTGKKSIISNILFSLCLYHSPKELNAYIIDSNEELAPFSKMPQVGEYLPKFNQEKVTNLLSMLKKEIKKRKKLISEYDNFNTYNQNSPYKMTLILIIIRDLKNFIDNNKDSEEFNNILNECQNTGIVFITSITDSNDINKTIASNFTTILGTKFLDQFDYRYILDAPKRLIPKDCYGRGLAKINDEVFEFQTALIASKDNVNKVIDENAIELKNHYRVKAKPVLVSLLKGDKKNEK